MYTSIFVIISDKIVHKKRQIELKRGFLCSLLLQMGTQSLRVST